jgi:DNA-binding SARP family transcriptional activator
MDPVLRVLGAPALRHVGGWSPLPLDLRTALVGVLAYAGGPMARGRLAAVFWPESDERAARQNLRQVVLRARELLGPGWIEGDAEALRLGVPSDMAALRAAIEGGDAVAAGELGLAPILQGLERLRNPEWQAWLDLERQALAERVRRVLLEAAAGWAHGTPPSGAVAVLAAWVDRDPFDDDLHAAYLRCAQQAPGESVAAAARLARIAALLDHEIGSGLAESVVLASTWLGDSGAHAAQEASAAETTRDTGRGGPLPLVGRQAELDALDAAVMDRSVTLVTVHGPGGIGKTRLVQAWATRFGNGVQMVAMAGAADAADAARPIAAAHGWRVADGADPRVVVDLLSRSVPAVVLDEVEGLPWLPTLLQGFGAAGMLTVVATSRERIGVDGEVLLRLGGLAWEGDGPALRLFRRAAARVRGTVDWDDDDRAAIARFAARVEGSPLALVLAAGWLQLGPPTTVLGSLLDDDDPLSFGEVLEPSWRRLSPGARDALQALSVFSAHFDVDAALEVAGCDRRTLRALVDAALVEPGTRDGLRLHPLVRLDAARRLAREDGARPRARRRHAEHLARTLGDRARELYGGPYQLEVHAEVGPRVADLEIAWDTACEMGAVDLLDRLLDCVWSFEMRGWFRLGATLTANAVEALERDSSDPRARIPLARALARQGIFAMRRGDAERTRATAQRSSEIFAAEGVDPDTFVLFHLGIADWLEGDVAGAARWHHELLALARRTRDRWAEGGALTNLGQIEIRRGHREEGLALLRASTERIDPGHDRWGAALLHSTIAGQLHEAGAADIAIRPHIDLAIDAAAQVGMRHLEAYAQVLRFHHDRRAGDHGGASVALERARALVAAGAMAELDPREAESVLVHETLSTYSPAVTDGVTPVSRPDA